MAVPMDLDEDFSSHRVTLIRAVRTIDEDVSTTLPAKVHKLWLLLSASKSSRLHGVEETVLRWLCKHMTGTTEDAELARRYPLSWAVLAHAFQKIPPQALGKCLADRKFVTILRQTVEEVSKPTGEGKPQGEGQSTTTKRKRVSPMPETLTELQALDGCIRSSVSMFAALGTLLGYGKQNDSSTSPQDRVGLEHIKSLFSSSSEETRDITSRLLWCSLHAAQGLGGSLSKEQENWVGISAAIWDLRLHSKDDTYEFARYLYAPICSTLGLLNGRAAPNTVEKIWRRQLEQLLGSSFMRPARRIFAQDGSVQNLKSALEITSGDPVTSSGVLWTAASRTPRDQTDPKSKAEHASWSKSVFLAVLEALKPVPRDAQNKAIAALLATAIETRSIPDTDVLRELANNNALQAGNADWELIGQVIACDPDVFLVDATAEDMLFDMATTEGSTHEDKKDLIVTKVVMPLIEASSKARDLAGFVKRWYDSLCKVTESQDKATWASSLWLDSRIRQRFADLLQASLSIAQILRLFEFLDTPESNPTALLVVLEGLCAGMTDEEYTVALDSKLFASAFQDKKYKKIPSDITALRWRIAGYMAAWEKSDDVSRLWEEIKSSLKKTLKSGNLADVDTLEAFRCCHEMWLTSYHGGTYEADAAKLSQSFLARLFTVLTSTELDELSGRYLDIVFGNLPRVAELGDSVALELREVLTSSFSTLCKHSIKAKTPSPSLLTSIRTLLSSDVEDQESFIDTLLGQVLDLLDGAEAETPTEEHWTLPVVLILEEFPTEAWTRVRRKRLLASWKKSQTQLTRHAAADLSHTAAVLRLLVKVAQQPTFYEGMVFQDLINLVESTDHTSADYLKSAAGYVDDLDAKHPLSQDFLILKGLMTALGSCHIMTRNLPISLDKVKIKLCDAVKYALADITKRVGAGSAPADGQEQVSPDDRYLLETILDAADSIPDPFKTIKLPKGSVLQDAAAHLVQEKGELGWKLRRFLYRNTPDAYDKATIVTQLEASSGEPTDESVGTLVQVITACMPAKEQAQLLGLCLAQSSKTAALGPLLAVRRILEHVPVLHGTLSAEEQVFDGPRIHNKITASLLQAVSLGQFKLLSDIMALLLDRHGMSMTQFNIESTLNVVAEIASAGGPAIQDGKGDGEIFECLYKLVATVIRRHRRRLEGHFPVLVATLQSLLRVLLADPLARVAAASTTSYVTHSTPAWLSARLRARHGARFARLLTLICEPSAAAVARSRRATTASAATTMLDSATDAAKRSAGQDMFHVVELYVKLQLEVAVPQDMRKALEPGVYSVLNITPEGCRRVMNESLDVNGRAVFRELFASYKKFGRWSGLRSRREQRRQQQQDTRGWAPEIHTGSTWGGTAHPGFASQQQQQSYPPPPPPQEQQQHHQFEPTWGFSAASRGLPPPPAQGDLLTLDLRALGLTERDMREAIAVLNQNRHRWGITEPITTPAQAFQAAQAHALHMDSLQRQQQRQRQQGPDPAQILREAHERWRYRTFDPQGRKEWKETKRRNRRGSGGGGGGSGGGGDGGGCGGDGGGGGGE
ncbi:Urb2/Npa2 family-domain-containing protein [Microdochium bolleyi]|uniref:Urb2/Npa2 family-domain-containing protein n=1 Tax=Microdochium bolleyi TaxID=196109 RepID=A0A136JKN0_9PEZI|nr:Urb2/Npa2 family-domain-containing protein [Microdochium bolleyi]